MEHPDVEKLLSKIEDKYNSKKSKKFRTLRVI